MGEVAEDMNEGACCSLCSTYFWKSHGYPVVCVECWNDLTPKEKKIHPKATHAEVSF